MYTKHIYVNDDLNKKYKNILSSQIQVSYIGIINHHSFYIY